VLTVELAPDAEVGILLSKDWFEWAAETKQFTAGTRLIFRLRADVTVTYRDKVNCGSVAIAGDVSVCGHLSRPVKIVYVDFERDECQGNPGMDQPSRPFLPSIIFEKFTT
jgi:fatty acid synthase subunit alpha, fungi type